MKKNNNRVDNFKTDRERELGHKIGSCSSTTIIDDIERRLSNGNRSNNVVIITQKSTTYTKRGRTTTTNNIQIIRTGTSINPLISKIIAFLSIIIRFLAFTPSVVRAFGGHFQTCRGIISASPSPSPSSVLPSCWSRSRSNSYLSFVSSVHPGVSIPADWRTTNHKRFHRSAMDDQLSRATFQRATALFAKRKDEETILVKESSENDDNSNRNNGRNPNHNQKNDNDKRPRSGSVANTNGNGKSKKIKGKNRGRELDRLAKTMNVGIPQLKDLLVKQRKKTQPGTEKAEYLDWILAPDTNNGKKNNNKISNKGGNNNTQNNNNNNNNNNNTQNNNRNARKSNDNTHIISTADNNPPRQDASSKTSKRKSSVVRPKKPKTIQSQDRTNDTTNPRPNEAATIQDPTLLTNVRFDQRSDLHPASKRALTEVLQLKSMTEIQSKTFVAASTGNDVLGRARTGTGKTLAFLIPAVERLLQTNNFLPGRSVGILVISPTRELATQIEDQAEKLLTYHSDLTTQVMYGGTKMGRDITLLNRRLPSVLVATPGRLLDHLESTKLNGRSFGRDIMKETPIVVLDETDRLLDMGFRREIKKILSYMPRKEKRQTLLFSATIPAELKAIMSENMRSDFVEVDCINDGDGASHTNQCVNQTHIVLPHMDRYVSSVVEIVEGAIREDEEYHKVVVFFPTARMVGFFATFFNEGLGIEVIELHSKKSQGYRNKASDKFRNAKSGVLFTSDVSARGVDYPDVTRVIQVGIPESREQYIHRLGRTGRGGKAGRGLLVLAPFESMFLSELKGLDIPVDSEVEDLLNNPVADEINDLVQEGLGRISNGDKQLVQSAQMAYQAFLGYYLGQMKRTKVRSKEELVGIANYYSSLMGLNEIPELKKNLIGKMGLKGVPGIVVGSGMNEKENRGRRGQQSDNRQSPKRGGGRSRSRG